MPNKQPLPEQNYFNAQTETDETPETEPQVLELHNRIKSLIRTIGKRMDIEVKTKMSLPEMIEMKKKGIPQDQAWYIWTEQDPKTKKVLKQFVRVPDMIMEDNERIALGKAAHEAGHLRVTRMHDVIPEQVWEELGLGMTLHSLEELSTDQSIRKYFTGAGQWVDEARQNMVIKSQVNISGQQIKFNAPKIKQIGNLLVYGEHGIRRDLYDQVVLDVYEQVLNAVREYEHTLPDENASEPEIIAKAKERYKIAYKQIWPKIKGLVQADLEAEEKRQALKKALQAPEQNIQDKLQELPPELQKELQKISEEIKQRVRQELKEQQKDLEKQITEKEQAIEQSNASPQEKEQLKDSLAKELAQAKKDAHSLNNPDKNEELSPETQTQLEQKDQEAQKDLANDIQKQIDQTEKELEDLYNDKESTLEAKAKKNYELEQRLKELKEDQKALNENKPEELSEKSQQDLVNKKAQAKDDLINDLQKKEAALKKQSEDLDKSSEQLQQEKQELEAQTQQNKADQKQINQEFLPQQDQASENMQKMLDKALSEINQRDIEQKLVQKLEDMLEKMFPGIVKEFQEQAKNILEQMEDQMIKELSSQIEQDAPTHKKINLEKERQKALEEQRKRLDDFKKQEEMSKPKKEADFQKIEANLKNLEGNKSVYDSYYEQVREYDRRLYRTLEEIFVPNIKSQVKLKSSGVKINLPAVFRWEASRGAMKGGAMKGGSSVDSRIFETVINPEKKDYAFCILNDVSSSMSGNRAVQDFKTKILISEVLNRLGIKFEIYSFSTGLDNKLLIPKLKDINEKLSEKVRQKMSGLIKTNNGTPTAEAIAIASKGFKNIRAKEKFMLVLTDGRPNNALATQNEIKQVSQNTDIKLIGIGLGENTNFVKNLFPISLPGVKFEELVEIFSGLMKDIVIHPKKYTFDAQDIEKFYQ